MVSVPCAVSEAVQDAIFMGGYIVSAAYFQNMLSNKARIQAAVFSSSTKLLNNYLKGLETWRANVNYL
jgi:hypothetical protein